VHFSLKIRQKVVDFTRRGAFRARSRSFSSDPALSSRFEPQGSRVESLDENMASEDESAIQGNRLEAA